MVPATAPAPAALRRLLTVAALLAVSAPLLAGAAEFGGLEGALTPRQGFWHYAILEDEASTTAEVRLSTSAGPYSKQTAWAAAAAL